VDPGFFRVQTKGKKTNEGIVHTPNITGLNKKLTYQVNLKGEGSVLLKVQETDERGQFIKERGLYDIVLTKDWKTYKMDIELEGKTSQIDVFVLTEKKDKTEFYFKNLEMKNR
jgi:hypothetical protein